MATLELQRAHLHPLTFPLTRLDSLSSLELALIQFHLDNDEPGFNDLVHKARTLWLDRRARAPIAARFALPLRPPSPPAPLSVPEDFVPLVEAIRAESNSPKHAPLCANVGSRALKLAPEIYKTGAHANFKALRVAAQKAGIVEFFRSNEGTGGGRDSIRLTSKYRDVSLPSPLALPARPVSETPGKLPTPTVGADNFHLARLDFDPSLDNLDALPTHELLLLQCRQDIAKPAHEVVERVFWRRRAAAFERGERWEVPPDAAEAPRSLPRSSTLPPVGPSPAAQGYTSSADSRGPAVLPPLPPLDERLPLVASDLLHPLEVIYIPPERVSTIPDLLALFPSSLLPLASILCPPSPTPVPSSSSGPASPVLARQAHIGFRSREQAAAAQADLDGLRVPAGEGAVFSLQVGPVSSGVAPRWQWGDVRPDERETLWRVACESRAPDSGVRGSDADEAVKRQREDGAGPDGRGASPKRWRVDVVEQVVAPSDRVPPHLIDALFPLNLSWSSIPKGLESSSMRDDAFVWRFNAAGWVEHPSSLNELCLLFTSDADRTAFARWVIADARRYWKKNGVVARDMPREDAAPLDWRFADLAPVWRREHGFVFSRKVELERPGTEGRRARRGSRPSARGAAALGGRQVRLRASSASSLAARLGGIDAGQPGSTRRDSRRDGDRFAPLAPIDEAASTESEPSLTGRSSGLGLPHDSKATLPPRLANLDALDSVPAFGADSGPFPSSLLDIPSDPFSSLPSPASPRTPFDEDAASDASFSSLDADDPPFFSILGAAKLYPAAAPPVRVDAAVKPPRIDAMALCDFADEVDSIMQDGARHFGEGAPLEEDGEKDVVMSEKEDREEQVDKEDVQPEPLASQPDLITDAKVDIPRDESAPSQAGPHAPPPPAPPASSADTSATGASAEPAAVASASDPAPATSMPSSSAPLPSSSPSADAPLQATFSIASSISGSEAAPSAPCPASDGPSPSAALSYEAPFNSGVPVQQSSTSGGSLSAALDSAQTVVERSPLAALSHAVAPVAPVAPEAGPGDARPSVDAPSSARDDHLVGAEDESGPLASPAPGGTATDPSRDDPLDTVDASSSSPARISRVSAAPSEASSSVAVVVVSASEATVRPPLAARFSSPTSPPRAPSLSSRLSPLPTSPPLASRLGLYAAPSTPPPPDHDLSAEASLVGGTGLSLVERLSPRVPGGLARPDGHASPPPRVTDGRLAALAREA